MEITDKEYKATLASVSESLGGDSPVFYITNKKGAKKTIETKVVVTEFLKRCKHVQETMEAINQSDPVADLMQYNGKI